MNRSSSTKWFKKLAVALGAAALTTSSAFSALARYNPYYSFFNPGPGLYESSDDANLLQQIAANNRLTRFSAALQATGMSELLSQKDTFTILAPTDEAFAMLPAGVWETLLKPENKEILRKVVNYHLVPGKVSNEELDAGKISTMAGESVRFQVSQGIAMLNEARLTQTQPIAARNGAIVVIDKVLLPADVSARLALGAISSSTTSSEPTVGVPRSPAGTSRVTFECHISATVNLPTTYAMTASGPRPLIRWTSEYFSDAGYTPEVRCQQVAARFQTFYNTGTLKYLASGYVNSQPVICVAPTQNTPCAANTVLFTLKPGSDANERLRKLLNLRSGASGADVLYESSSDEAVYVDFEQYLNTSTVERIGSSSNYPSPTVPSAIEEPSAPSGGGVW